MAQEDFLEALRALGGRAEAKEIHAYLSKPPRRHVDPPTIYKSAKRLEARGVIRRVRDGVKGRGTSRTWEFTTSTRQRVV